MLHLLFVHTFVLIFLDTLRLSQLFFLCSPPHARMHRCTTLKHALLSSRGVLRRHYKKGSTNESPILFPPVAILFSMVRVMMCGVVGGAGMCCFVLE